MMTDDDEDSAAAMRSASAAAAAVRRERELSEEAAAESRAAREALVAAAVDTSETEASRSIDRMFEAVNAMEVDGDEEADVERRFMVEMHAMCCAEVAAGNVRATEHALAELAMQAAAKDAYNDVGDGHEMGSIEDIMLPALLEEACRASRERINMLLDEVAELQGRLQGRALQMKALEERAQELADHMTQQEDSGDDMGELSKLLENAGESQDSYLFASSDLPPPPPAPRSDRGGLHLCPTLLQSARATTGIRDPDARCRS